MSTTSPVNPNGAWRTERDSLGERQVPADALYGIHTVRSLGNFSLSDRPLPGSLIRAVVALKHACATANEELALLDTPRADAIRVACESILNGEAHEAFPVDRFQAGSGTSSNMNINEVIANLARRRLGGDGDPRQQVHPNDHVNRGQSTNNIFPSAIRVAALQAAPALLAATGELGAQLTARAQAFAQVRKSGRTHLQDAVPLTLGQEFAAYARAVEKSADRIRRELDGCRELGVGGNAVGTGLNAPESFRQRIVIALSNLLGEPFRVAQHGVEATQFLTDLLGLSGALRGLAVDVNKVANDLRLLASGPNTGLAEITLPPVEPGSSIMPGKINPSICEAVNMVCLQVMGCDQAILLGCNAGQLELNTHMPLVGCNLLEAIDLLTRACHTLAERCIVGIQAHTQTCAHYFERSAGLATVLNPILGYDRVAELVKESLATGHSLRQLVLAKQILPESELHALLEAATGPLPDPPHTP